MTTLKWKQPIFILGNPRSGTSLLRLMLDSHSAISIPPESHFFLWLEEKYGNWKSQFLDDYLADLFASTKFETWNFRKEELRGFITASTYENYAQLTSLVYQFYAINTKSNAIFWGDKNSLWVDKLNKINFHFPNAYYVYIIRDGRDVACSYKALGKKKMEHKYAPQLDNDVSKIAKTWSHHNTKLQDFLFENATDRFVKVRYEDLLREPKQTLDSILDLLDLELEKTQLNYFNRPKETIEPEVFFNWKEKLLTPLDVTNIGKYTMELSEDEIDVFNTLAYSVLQQNSYL